MSVLEYSKSIEQSVIAFNAHNLVTAIPVLFMHLMATCPQQVSIPIRTYIQLQVSVEFTVKLYKISVILSHSCNTHLQHT